MSRLSADSIVLPLLAATGAALIQSLDINPLAMGWSTETRSGKSKKALLLSFPSRLSVVVDRWKNPEGELPRIRSNLTFIKSETSKGGNEMKGQLIKVVGWLLLSVSIHFTGVLGISSARASSERVEKAKKEGVVNFYFVWNLPHGQAVAKAFNRKFPSIKVNLYRSGGSSMVNKLDIEAKTGRHDVDVIIMSDLYWQSLMDRDLIAAYCSPQLPAFPTEFKDPKCLWTVLNINTHVIAYNTELVPKEARPGTLEDLLHPRWKGKLVMDTTDERWFTQTLDKMGEERGMAFMKKLAAQKPQFRRGHTMMLQLLAVGEFPVNVIAYGYQVEYLKKQGAPLGWSADEPVTSTGGVISLAKHAPHPEAAKLFIDFAMSKLAQEEITKFNRVATRVDVPPNPPHLVEGLKMAPVKPELGKLLRNRTVQFRKIFGIQ